VNAARIVAVHTMIGGVYELELRGGTRLNPTFALGHACAG
jgi:hypothetical protein